MRTSTSSGSTAPAGTTSSPEKGQNAPAQNSSLVPTRLDWRALLLITASLSIAFTLISMGYQAIQRK